MYFKVKLRDGEVCLLNLGSEQAEAELLGLLRKMYRGIPLAVYSFEQWVKVLRREIPFEASIPVSVRELLLQLSPDLVEQFVYGENEDLSFPPLEEAKK